MALERVKAESAGAEPGGWPTGYVLDDRYKIVRQLATTRCSEIYLTEELQPPHHTLVVKRLKPGKLQDEVTCKRFEREIVVLRQIRHQSVLVLYDCKTVGQDRYFATEFADKGTLSEYLATRPDRKLRSIEALEIALSACQGLEAAHRQGIIHRDIKPGNIFLFSQRDDSIVAKLADFSIARVPQELRDETLTEIDTFMGTLDYACPEQLRGHMDDPRSDLYSWAIVFFEMLTGESPTDSLKDPLTLHPTSDEFSTSFFTERGVPLRLVEVLQKGLYEAQELRYQSAAEIRKALEAIKSQLLADIERHLSAGEAHVRSLEWHAAEAEFEQGLALCGWYGEPSTLLGPVGGLARRLRMGNLYAQGMIRLSEQQWQAAIEALDPLRTLDPSYLGLDIGAQLKLAQSERQREQRYQLLLHYQRRKNWTEILRLATDLTTNCGPEDESVGDIRKLALYARGKKLLDEGELEEAYHQLYRLYERDPNYGDVAELCAIVAFRNGMRADIPVSREHQVRWLERVLEIDPNHREGRTRHQLDRARHRWAEELLKENRFAAVTQLERISPDYNQWKEAYQALVSTYYQLLREGDYSSTERANLDAEAEARYRLSMELWDKGNLQGAVEQLTGIYPQAKNFEEARSDLAKIYVALGQQAHQDGHWHKATEWWDKATVISQSLEKTLRWRVREARVRAWINFHSQEITLITALCTVLAVVVAIWRWDGGGAGSATPTPKPVTLCNGSFQDDLECWEHGGKLDQTVECDGDQCFAVLGNPDYPCGEVPVGEAWITQTVRVPQISPTLSLRYRIFSYDLDIYDPGLPGDYFQVAINSNPLSEQYGNIDWDEARCNGEPWSSGWQNLPLDLNDYRGQEVEILLHIVSTDPYYNTWTYVDDVGIDGAD